MSNAPWLFNHKNLEYVRLFLYRQNYPNLIDYKKYLSLEKKKSAKVITPQELQRFETLHKTNKKMSNIRQEAIPIDKVNMPNTVYALLPIDTPKLREKILSNGSIFLHESIATVLMQFDLGQTLLSQVEIINIETDERVTDEVYYYVHLAETRDYFLAEESCQVSGNIYNPAIKVKSIDFPNDGDIALNADVQSCSVDLWHDPMLRNSWFMSDRLIQALIQAGLTPQQDIDLVQCRLV